MIEKSNELFMKYARLTSEVFILSEAVRTQKLSLQQVVDYGMKAGALALKALKWGLALQTEDIPQHYKIAYAAVGEECNLISRCLANRSQQLILRGRKTA